MSKSTVLVLSSDIKRRKISTILVVLVVLTSVIFTLNRFDINITENVAASPAVQFTWIDDDGDVWSDADTNGVIPYIPLAANVPLDIQFQISDNDNTYYGATNQQQVMGSITISGNALFNGTLDKIPGVSFSDKNWTVPIIPTMSQGGGTITISGTWTGHNSFSETLTIGGDNYLTNGTIVTVTPNEFEIGTDKTLTIQVTDADGTSIDNANVYLYYIDDGSITPANAGKPITGHMVNTTTTSSGVCSIIFNKTQQTTNQTAAGFMAAKAPRNLTAYVNGSGHLDGYALVEMEPATDLKVNLSNSTLMAGYSYNGFTINCTIFGSADTPSTEEVDKSQFHIKIYDENDNDVTGTSNSDNLLHNIYFTQLTGANVPDNYSFNFNNVYALDVGTYTVYAYNNTHSSVGHNATLTIEPVNVTSDKSEFIWNVDTNINATLQITYNGTGVNGTLRIDNMSDAGSYNTTWTNCSFNGASDVYGNVSINCTVTNGVANLYNVTAENLTSGEICKYVTFWFKPTLSNGSEGQWARARGNIPVKTPDVAASPASLPYNTAAELELTVTGRGTGLSNVYVSIQVPGISGEHSTTTNSEGKASFSFIPVITGDITIKTENRTSTTTVSITAVANTQPTASTGGPYYSFINQNVTFDGSGSSDSDGTISNYSWNFGDGNTGYGVSTTHAYTTAGTYTVNLTATDNDGDNNSAVSTVTAIGTDNYTINLTSGWNLVSTPKRVNKTSLNQIIGGTWEIAYSWNSSLQIWEQTSTLPQPLEPIFIKMSGSGNITFNWTTFNNPVSPLTRNLSQGWALVGGNLRVSEFNGLSIDVVLDSIEQNSGSNLGYNTVISTSYNSNEWTATQNTKADYTILPFEGYWAYMENADILVGRISG